MDIYQQPAFLKERYTSFEQRWELRDQFNDIINLIEENKEKLRCMIGHRPDKKDEIEELIQQMDEFKVWSWREVDMDEEFYNRIEEFDKNTFILINK